MLYINEVLKMNLINNFYLFKSPFSIKSDGKNNTNLDLIKKLKITSKNRVNVNLNGDSLYKVEL